MRHGRPVPRLPQRPVPDSDSPSRGRAAGSSWGGQAHPCWRQRLASDRPSHNPSPNADNLGWFGWFGAGRVVAAGGRSTGCSPGWPADGRRLGRPDDDDCLGWEQRRLGPGAMAGAFDAEVAHLAFDHAREGAQAARGQRPLGDLPRDARQRSGLRLRGGWPPARWW